METSSDAAKDEEDEAGMKNMDRRSKNRDAEKARKADKHTPGTVIEASDRKYVVDAGGSLRVLSYNKE